MITGMALYMEYWRKAAQQNPALNGLASWDNAVTEEKERWEATAEAANKMVIPLKIPGDKMVDIEKYATLKTLESVGWSSTQAAKILGFSVRKVQYMLRRWREESKAALKATLP